jgi:alpha-2-macroglobulin
MDAWRTAWGRVKAGLGMVLGEWSAPPWWSWTARQTARGASAGVGVLRRHPKASVAVLLGLAAAGYGAHEAYRWWSSRPRPVEVQLQVQGPTLTDFANGGSPQPVVVTFSASVAALAQVGKAVETGLAVSPAVEGRWNWRDDRHLVFEPKAEWAVGTRYEVQLQPSLFAPEVRLQSDRFSFSSAPFTATLKRAEFYQDPFNPTLKKGVVELAFSHPVNPAELEKRIELRLAGQAEGVLGVGRESTPFTLTYDKLKLNAYVHSATLPIPKETTQLSLVVDKGVAAQAGGAGSASRLAASIQVPGLYALQVAEVSPMIVTNERFEPEQVLVVRTTQLVHERELARHVSAWVLPLKHPSKKPEEQGDEPYPWSDPSEVTQAVLAASARLPLAPVPAEHEHTDVHSFKLRADVGRVVYVQIEPKFKSFGGYLMRNRHQQLVTVPPYPPELRILSEGALLALSGEKKLAVLVRDLPGLKVEIGRVQASQLQHLVSQSQGHYSKPEFFGSFGPDNLIDRFERTIALPSLAPGKPHYEAIDLGEYLGREGEARKGLFLLSVSGFDPKAQAAPAVPSNEAGHENGDTEPNEAEPEAGNGVDPAGLQQKRLVLVTDLGIVLKQSTDGSRDVFVQSLHTGTPVAGAQVEVVAKNGSAVASQATDASGRAHFDKLEGLSRERAPLLLTVRKAGDMSFMPLNRNDRVLDVSRFDVGGLQNARSQDELGAYLFSDRGIYRPGETLHVGMIVKSADWSRSLAGVPLEAEVLDARGLTVKRERLRLPPGGFAELQHTTLPSAPTGNYTVNLHIVKDDRTDRQIGSVSVKVQEFLPDRMKVSAQLSAPPAEGWVHPRDLKGRINAQNLFGTPAENRRVEASLSLSPAWPAFRGFDGYSFFDPQRAKEGVNDVLPEGQTDARGEAEFDLRLGRFEKATYRLSLLARVYEPEGGRSVSAETSALVSERAFLVGVKHDGDLGYVSMGSKRVSQLVAIDPQAQKVAAPGLTLQFVERKMVSMLIRQANDTYRYESRKKESVLSETPLSIAAQGHGLVLDTAKAGNYSYVLRDAQGLELNRVDYSVAGQGNVSRSLERNAELQLALNRRDYQPGEEIEISIRAPYVGAGLITIERDKVYAHAWFKAGTTASVQKIRVPKDFEGNGYVNVQFVRDPSSDEIFMSPMSHGVVPFATSLSKRTQALTLNVPELVKPGQVLKLKLASTQPTRAVVFAVDEGILQVARYQTADPLAHFFQKRALEVRTSQILDLLLPEFKRLMAQSAPGGDEAGASGRFLNPFKRRGEAPAVYWSGLVDLKGEREFSYTVPDHFNGSLRVMAVAVNEGAVGVTQGKALVRGDFVLSPNLPLAVAPGDLFDVSVGVANNIADAPKDAPVKVMLKAPAGLDLVGEASQTLKIGALREGVARFRLKVKDTSSATLGPAMLEFSASLGNRSALRRVDLSVRPATPRLTTLSLGHFTGSTDLTVPRDLVPEHRRQEVAISALPLALAPGLMSYLDSFPHQCTEQMVSRVLPALVLARRPEFGTGTPQATGKAMDEVLRVLRSRQNAQGGFGLWTASVQADEFASVYAMHMLLEARELDLPGVAVPPDLLRKVLDYAQALAASNPADLAGARQRAYAIYLLTRNGAVTTPLVASLRETLEAKHGTVWKRDATAAFLAATYQLLKQEKPAAELMEGLAAALEKREPEEYRFEAYHDPVVRDAQTLYLLARHFPPRLKALSPEALTRFVAPLENGRFNTLSSAYTVLALEAMARSLEPDALGKLSVVQLDAKGAATPVVLPATLLPRAAVQPGTVKLQLGNESRRTTYYGLTQGGFDRQPPTSALRQGLEVLREYVGADGKPATSVKLGDELTVRLSLRAVQGGVPSVALTDLLPGGFEVVQSRDADGNASTVTGNGLSYADVREDRVVLYADAGTGVQVFSYRLRATNSGEFTVPPAQAESMYDRQKQARAPAGRITVTAAGGK